MSNPLVSVIVPIYKVEKYLDKCVQSILSQTYTNLEIWLVDDGSPDNCGKMCDEYAERDPRIHVIHKDNGGLSDARNVAIDAATGDWITCIDSDDFVAPNYIEYMLNMVLHNRCQCSVVQPLNFIEGSEPDYSSQEELLKVMSGTDAISAMFYQTLFDTSAWGKLYHRSLFESGIRYPKGLLFEDNPTTYLLLDKCEKVAISQKKLYFYLIRKNSIQGMDFDAPKLDQGLKILEMMQQHPEIMNKVYPAYRCKMASLAFHFIMKMPEDYNRKSELLCFVKKNRWNVIWNRKARLKTRIGCFLSYFGVHTMKKNFKFVSER